ncbi:glycosyl transferase family protein [Microvirga guangxiensis]|uniref:Anthranilate phosphoribosyltransferase n=1 Tax=Microvirga guangxiensis TaxID=549386 RepID=A0A1G5GYZ2_9HYPH|nr:glycosyl transferase family protein [Microvirga guangxiensis]SCY56704.1 Anthranilate phosphoribosyltransferase [Microvirga guangxiensis]
MDSASQEPGLKLGRLRLLLALDTLLVEGSVNRAAERLGMSAPAMSRLLGQVREIYNDPLFVRSSRRLIPTPFAETMRQRLRALAAEAEALSQPQERAPDGTLIDLAAWASAPVIEAAPLTVRRSVLLEGEPPPETFARKLASLGKAEDTRKRLAKHIATMGAGIGHSRPLTIDEAEDALSIILDGKADPIQIGALFSVMNFRGETAAELAGFVRAARTHIGAADAGASYADLDWPAYISPKSRRMPWFLQAALLLAQVGHRILLHGMDGGDGTKGKIVSAAKAIGIPVCTDATNATDAIAKHGIAYLPVAAMSSQLHRLHMLYGLFETRLPVNSMMPLLNPLGAPSLMMGVTRPAYRELHCDTGALLGHRNLTVVGASRDAAEAAPFRSSTLLRLVDGKAESLFISASPEPPAYPTMGMASLEYWQSIWTGTVQDERAAAIIVATAGIALLTLRGGQAESFGECLQAARELWEERRRDLFQQSHRSNW